MKEISIEEVKYMLSTDFSGIIVAVPVNSLTYNAELYIYGSRINSDNKREISLICYNMEDGICDGFAAINIKLLKEHFEEDNDFRIKYYLFDNLLDFCNWYIQKNDKLHQALEQFVKDTQKFYKNPLSMENYENKGGVNESPTTPRPEPPKGQGDVCEKCDKRSEFLKEFENIHNNILKQYRCGDVYTHDEIRDKINPGWNTRREKLADVLKLLELRDLRQNTIDMLVENITPEKRCYLEKQLERDEKRIEDFLNERI